MKLIQSANLEFDAIACSGASGTLIAPIVAYIMQKNLLYVRKPNEKTHSKNTIEGLSGLNESFNYIIIDDCIVSGRTMQHQIKTIQSHQHTTTLTGIFLSDYIKLKAVFLWDHDCFAPGEVIQKTVSYITNGYDLPNAKDIISVGTLVQKY